jgi:hypothetical protein
VLVPSKVEHCHILSHGKKRATLQAQLLMEN